MNSLLLTLQFLFQRDNRSWLSVSLLSNFLMRRTKSDTSFLTMSHSPKGFGKADQYNYEHQAHIFTFPCSFDPMDSDTYENLDISSSESFYIPDAQPLPPDARDPAYYDPESQSSDSETYSEYPEPTTQTCPDEQAIHLTDLKNCRETLATLSHYSSGQIGQFLKKSKGLLCLPLHAVSVFRIPHGNHTGNYPILIYYPEKDLKYYPHLATFNEAIDVLYGEE